jgi:hypothetical protein
MSELGARHVWQKPMKTAPKPDMSDLPGSFGLGIVCQEFALHQLTQCILLDSTELLGYK